MKILVVDDVGYTCHFHTRLIEQFGYSACSANSGYEALNMLKTDNDISIVITDLMMRGMDGVDLFMESQNLERFTDEGTQDPPQFILMTALRMQKNSKDKDILRLKLAEELGISKIMFKPLDQEELKQTLHEMAMGVPQISSADKAVDLYTPTQSVKDAVKGIIDSRNPGAAEQFMECLSQEVASLKEFLTALETVES
ncbi:response regulator [Gimesia panareensis]|uniref:Sensory/regulatory protein RpfC n=1 Tax=Gimesia panareensis TaxID=2527978 RepID=A0A517QCR8_9PLAN|nr:response regulator [Gimesia panareensis]QDT29427.1 Sensory/regulatory protein RpfC [Gimesia panareensis]QDU52475.1 Sensory/regulatory protein RpfC [Gimesia panareensis]